MLLFLAQSVISRAHHAQSAQKSNSSVDIYVARRIKSHIHIDYTISRDAMASSPGMARNSPNLNSIQRICGSMKRKLNKTECEGLNDLQSVIQEVCGAIIQDTADAPVQYSVIGAKW
jgi:hypothetical protein